jgi:LEA14-like dessication related protein
MSVIRTLPGVCACLLALSCATQPVPVEAPVPLTLLTLSVEDAALHGLDIDSIRLAVNVVASNDGETGIPVGMLDVSVVSGGVVLQGSSLAAGTTLEAGGHAVFALEFKFDAPSGDSPWIDLRIEAAAVFRGPDGGSRTARAVYDTRFPRILPPVLEIRAIRILKDELINTRLGVDLAVHNPNVFPLSFASLGYKLYGEGRYWAGDTLSKSFEVPAGQTAEASLYMTMNFTDMDRRLLDRVIRLAAVGYRLGGTACIDTGLDFLPRFELPFELAGTTGVLR